MVIQSTQSFISLRSDAVEGDIQVGEWVVQPKLNTISGDGRTARVEPKAMQVLVYLAEHAGDVMPKERIIQAVWADTFVTDDVLTRNISELRKVFNDDPHEPRFIQTIAKGGYRLIAPVERVGEPIGAVRALPQQRRQLALIALSAITLLTLAVYFARQRFWPKAQPLTTKVRLVVLPFDNLSGDAAQEYFSDGMTEEMTAQLSRLQPERLAVIGRSSAMTYRGAKKTIDQIGKELSVQYVLEGSVRRAGERVRITAQLVEVGDQTHVWAQEYDRDLRDVMSLEDEVAQSIAREVKVTLTPEERTRLAQRRQVNPEAHEAYLKGSYYLKLPGEDGTRKSREFFEQATAIDPDYALGYSGLSDYYGYMFVSGLISQEEGCPKAEAAAVKAVELDESLAEAHTSLGAIKFYCHWDWAGGESEIRRALQLNPSLTDAHVMLANISFRGGRSEVAVTEMRKAIQNDPMSLEIIEHLGFVYYMTRHYDLAIEQYRKVLELNPAYFDVHDGLGDVYAVKGMLKEAISEYQKFTNPSESGQTPNTGLARAYALSGRRADALRILSQMEVASKHRPIMSINRAVVYIALGDKEQAFAWLEKAYELHEKPMLSLKADPIYDPLRSDLRFHDLLRRMNFPL